MLHIRSSALYPVLHLALVFVKGRTAVAAIEKDQKILVTEQEALKIKVTLYERIFKELASGKALSPDLLHQYGF
ncbi:MAG: hypothetical protein NW207_02915 [Cytophagales bacterium]|nr:hypothetical protein [Cytophagales bacterium]